MQFQLKSDYLPTGDQPAAIAKLVEGVQRGDKHQVLLGATGTGKTFTIANLVAQTQRPTLVMAHNKTLAAQLYAEFKEFFPRNAVEYFVSYYDYYQPAFMFPPDRARRLRCPWLLGSSPSSRARTRPRPTCRSTSSR